MIAEEIKNTGEFEPVEKEKELSPNDEFTTTIIYELIGRMDKSGLLDIFGIEDSPVFQLIDEARDQFLKSNDFLFFSDFLEKYLHDTFPEEKYPEYNKFFTFLISEVRGFAEVYHRGYSDAFKEKTGLDLDEQIYLDPLTKISNRLSYDEDLDNLINDRREDSPDFALILLDIDDFKLINDGKGLGHLAGDRALVGLSKTIEEVLRGGDKIYRIGGDEFAIIARGDKENILKMIDRVLETIRKAVFIFKSEEDDAEEKEIRITLSMGGAFSGDMGDKDTWSKNKIYGRADSALYRVKEKGKNQFAEYSE